jgi:hypothetical protein
VLLLTGTLIFDEVKLQAFFERVFVDIIFNTDPRTREKEIFKICLLSNMEILKLSLGEDLQCQNQGRPL